MLAFPPLLRVMPHSKRTSTGLRIAYQDGQGLLRDILVACTQLRFAIDNVELVQPERAIPREEAQDRADWEGTELQAGPEKGVVTLTLQVKGKRPVSHLVAKLSDISGVVRVGTLGDPEFE